MFKLVVIQEDMSRVVFRYDSFEDVREALDEKVISIAKSYIDTVEVVSTLHIDKIGRKKKHVYHQLPYDLITGHRYYSLIHEDKFVIGGVILEKGDLDYEKFEEGVIYAAVC